MAHYACDCWDAEIEMSMGWVECVGIADRSAYDLTCHGTFTNTSLTASAPLETPIKVEKYVVTKKALAAMGKEFKKDAKAVSEALTALDSDGLKALEAKAKAEGKATIAGFEISAEMLQCESKTEVQHVDVFTPNVIEPSFGIDRVLTAIYEHTFYVRAADGEERAPAAEASDGKKKKEKAKDDKQKPGVLGFPPEVAPYKCVVLPLDMRIAQSPEYAAMMVGLRTSLAEAGLQYKVDESGAAVGRRYARADELGVPFAITIDFDTLGIGAKESTNSAGYATLRERDSTHQVRLPLSDLPTIVAKLVLVGVAHVGRPRGRPRRRRRRRARRHSGGRGLGGDALVPQGARRHREAQRRGERARQGAPRRPDGVPGRAARQEVASHALDS